MKKAMKFLLFLTLSNLNGYSQDSINIKNIRSEIESLRPKDSLRGSASLDTLGYYFIYVYNKKTNEIYQVQANSKEFNKTYELFFIHGKLIRGILWKGKKIKEGKYYEYYFDKNIFIGKGENSDFDTNVIPELLNKATELYPIAYSLIKY